MIPPLEFPMTNIYIFAATIFAFGLSATDSIDIQKTAEGTVWTHTCLYCILMKEGPLYMPSEAVKKASLIARFHLLESGCGIYMCISSGKKLITGINLT
jgi:hypothetical protein